MPDLGKVAYEAFRKAMQDVLMLSWSELSTLQQSRWRDVSQAVLAAAFPEG